MGQTSGFRIRFGARALSGAAAWIALVGIPAGLPFAAKAQVSEYQLKAAFLFNFAKFVEWPAGAFQTPSDPIAICVLGDNPFGDALAQTVAGKTVAERRFEIRELAAPPAPRACQMLFVGAASTKRFREIPPAVRREGLLTVGETPEFTGYGGIIAFKQVHGNIRLEINLAAAERSQMKISSKLLSLAEVTRKAP